jgi:hypothetical protein
MGGDTEVEDPAALVSQHEEDLQDLKTDGRHREEVDCGSHKFGTA